MPNFMYTIILLSGLSWFGWYKALTKTGPDSILSIVLFLGLIFIAVSLTLSIPLYFVLVNKADVFENLNIIYRRSIKWSSFVALGITSVLAFRAFDILDPIYWGIFGLVYVLVFLKLRSV